MKKKIYYLVIAFMLISSAVSASALYESYKGRPVVKIIYMGEEIKASDVPAYVESNRTMVPLNMLNKMGFETKWDSTTQSVSVDKNESWMDESYSSSEKEMPGEFQIIGHRGESTEAPENTIAGFKYAIDHGVKYLETDVQMTKDGVPILIHDDAVDRTTNGHGKVKELTLEEIRKLDAGSWKSEKYKDTQIPTLDEFIALLKANPDVKVYFEVKGYRSQSDIDTYIEQITPVKAQMIVHTLKKVDSDYIKQKYPDLIRSYDPGTTEEINQYIKESLPDGGITMSVPNYLVSYPFIKWAHSLKIKILVWPIDDEKELFMYRLMGADGVVTFSPSKFQEIINK